MEFKLCRPGAQEPIKKHKTDAGWDVYSPIGFTLYPQVPTVVPLGLQVQLPKGTVLLTQGRSSLAHKHGITTIGNVIDEGYTGEIHVCLLMSVVPPLHLGDIARGIDVSGHYFQHQKGLRKFIVNAGDRIAQLVLVNRCEVELIQREASYQFEDTDRGANGFGSTGV